MQDRERCVARLLCCRYRARIKDRCRETGGAREQGRAGLTRADGQERLEQLADNAERDGRVQEAMRVLQEAVAECPTLSSARFNLAVLTLRTQGASRDVVEHLRCAQEQEPDNAIYATMYQRVRGFVDRASPGGKS